jgi:sulfatase modifying factor 1
MIARCVLPIILIGFIGITNGTSATETFRDCPDCPIMVKLPSGSFMMGSSEVETRREGTKDEDVADERPQHSVTIRREFAIGQYAVTRGEFGAFIANTNHDPRGCSVFKDGTWVLDQSRSGRNPGYAQTDAHPVVCVSLEDTQRYVQWLSRKTGQSYRLPTEAEWEYAARAGTTTARFWGDGRDRACDFANAADFAMAEASKWNKDNQDQVFQCNDTHAYTAPVGSFRPNAFGLHDMLGNVFQWTEDCHHNNYDGAPSDGSARTTGECKKRVLRGGSWANSPWIVRSAFRLSSTSVQPLRQWRLSSGQIVCTVISCSLCDTRRSSTFLRRIHQGLSHVMTSTPVASLGDRRY